MLFSKTFFQLQQETNQKNKLKKIKYIFLSQNLNRLFIFFYLQISYTFPAIFRRIPLAYPQDMVYDNHTANDRYYENCFQGKTEGKEEEIDR